MFCCHFDGNLWGFSIKIFSFSATTVIIIALASEPKRWILSCPCACVCGPRWEIAFQWRLMFVFPANHHSQTFASRFTMTDLWAPTRGGISDGASKLTGAGVYVCESTSKLYMCELKVHRVISLRNRTLHWSAEQKRWASRADKLLNAPRVLSSYTESFGVLSWMLNFLTFYCVVGHLRSSCCCHSCRLLDIWFWSSGNEKKKEAKINTKTFSEFSYENKQTDYSQNFPPSLTNEEKFRSRFAQSAPERWGD